MSKKAVRTETSEVPEKYTDPPKFDAVDYIRRRVDDKIEKYSKRGFRYRCWYLGMTSTATVLAASVPVLINMNVGTLAPTLLSLAVTVLVGIEGIFHFREQWRNYDLLKSRLREERWLYMTRSGGYVGKNEGEALQLFVQTIEEDISRERMETIGLRTMPQQRSEPDVKRTENREKVLGGGVKVNSSVTSGV